MKTNRNVSILLENGFHFSTISKMKPNEVKLLTEKFFKPRPMGDVEQAKKDSMKSMRAFLKNNQENLGLGNDPNDFSEEQVLDKVKGLAYHAKSPNSSKLNKMAGELYRIAKPLFKGSRKETKEQATITKKTVNQAQINSTGEVATTGPATVTKKGTQTIITSPEPIIGATSGEVTEKFESKAQQGLFWAKCNNSTGKTKEKWCKMAKEFSDSTSKKQYKNMPEKKHPEKTVKRKTNENLERFLEDKILDMLDEHINPTFTKGNMLKTISEKSNKFNSMILRNPKKMSMFSDESGIEMKKMKRPISSIFSLGEDTKEKERTREKDRTKEKDRKKNNPFRDPNPGVEEQPKAGTKEKERTKEREKTKTPTRRKGNPFKDPNPGVEEQPKAKMEKQQSNFIDAIMNVLNF